MKLALITLIFVCVFGLAAANTDEACADGYDTAVYIEVEFGGNLKCIKKAALDNTKKLIEEVDKAEYASISVDTVTN